MSLTRTALVAGALAVASLGAGSAHANCLGSVACTQNRTIVSGCVNTGNACVPFQVSGPVCIYGQTFTTTWC
jgi:hypothetical protein